MKSMKFDFLKLPFLVLSIFLCILPSSAQQTQGAITGTVSDATGAAVPDATVKALNAATNLEVTATSGPSGTYSIPNLPAGAYKVTFSKQGFKTDEHTSVLVNGNRTATVDANLAIGEINSVVEVTATPLMNQVDTTSGYVVDELTIQNTPLGTGSFTQLAILSPGVHADFLGGGGANTGLGNQAIFADGNRDTSNSFSLNGVSTNNLFNGNSTSQVGENRFVLNTGEVFGANGVIQTSTSVYGAIGQALPTPPPDAIQEISVNTSMYDASQGNNSGAHISVLTKSGTNAIHGSVYWNHESSSLDAAPYFYKVSSSITTKNPFLNRNQFGATFGGPIKHDKLFYFLSYQGVRIADAQSSLQDVTVPFHLTDDRSAQGIANTINADYFPTCGPGQTPAKPCVDPSQMNQTALNVLNLKLNGKYLIPSVSPATFAAGIQNAITAGYDVAVQGPNTISSVDQGIADIDYAVSDKDRLSGKYYVQLDPTSNPFGSAGGLLGFPQELSAGSQVASIGNTYVFSPTLSWEQHFGYTRLKAYSHTQSAFSASSIGIDLLGSNAFPQLSISSADPNIAAELQFGPSPSFGNAGMYQNQFETGSSVTWIKGKHTISAGFLWDHSQLNIINNNTNTDTVSFSDFVHFAEGEVHDGSAIAGAASRYYRADTVGAYANDNFKLRSNLNVTVGLRWDLDGALSEKYGKLTNLDLSKYKYVQCTVGGVQADPTSATCDPGTDTIVSSGLEIAGNNKTGATSGASNTLINGRQWNFAPRIGIAWSPFSKMTVRAGYGIFNDRGELFSYLSPSAGAGFNGPFGVTLAAPFVAALSAASHANFTEPFGTTVPATPAGTAASFLASVPNLSQTACGQPGCWPGGNLFGPILYGGYDTHNKLPYVQNWTLDLQYQFSNDWLVDLGYVGNHGTRLVVPIPFNQPSIATATNPVNGQTTSYGGTTPLSLDNEPVFTNEYSGNAPIRVPYPGYDMNSVLFEAAGTSNYDALQAQVKKRLSFGLQFTASYTYSHSLDEQSGLGLFFTGNNPANLKSNYASSDFDQTHVFLINYSYTLPSFAKSKAWGEAVNGWSLSGQTVAQSGQPYSVYDYSGSVASLYYGTAQYITNAIVPLKPGVTPKQAELQGTLGVNPALPVLNAADFAPQFVAPGTNGVPPCDPGCDNFESLFGNSGRNLFRAPFQVRSDMSLAKVFPINERFRLRAELEAFNVFNQIDFDAPNNNVTFFPGFVAPKPPNPVVPTGSLGYIQHTVGSPRFLQVVLHLAF